ncbi:MAG: PAS domain-containing protein [Methanoregula sp.]|nr:PAS domain-containing protein [Methanoregula sp.]MDD5024007.1 PAS domain-containing protein [Methanoregula sp.]MDD5186698.1 PAS domain-containing protein [Methanoregula sp.]
MQPDIHEEREGSVHMMQDYQQELAAIKELLKKNLNGMSVTDISKALKKNKNTIGRYLDILLISGHVVMRTYGMAKVFTLSERVPLSAILSYANDMIMLLDDGQRIVEINDHFLNLLHLSREDTLGKNLEFINPPEVDVHELLASVREGCGKNEHIVTFRLKGGEERIFKQKSIPSVFDDGGKGLTIILEDITESIHAEREIRESEERFRMMAENIQDGLIIMENNKHVFVNRRIAEMTGYSFEELWTMGPLALVEPEYHDSVREQMGNLENSGDISGELQMWITTKEGKRRFVYARITSAIHSGTRYFFIILTDLTELKEREAELSKSEQRFRMMAENMQDGLVIVENSNFVFANRRLSEISGYSNEELQMMRPPDLISPEDMHTIENIFNNAQGEPPAPEGFTIWINRKDKQRRCILMRVNVAHQDSTVSTYITMTDITESAEREQALRDRIASLQQLLK